VNKKPFVAANWLSTNKAKKSLTTNAPTSAKAVSHHLEQEMKRHFSTESKGFSINSYVVPQWKGESLLTKNALKLKNHIKLLFNEAQDIIKTFPSRNKSLKQSIFNEFQSYISAMNIELKSVRDYQDFWHIYETKSSNSYQHIIDFLDLFCLRAVNIYLLKIRFVSLITESRIRPLSPSELLNPDSTLSKIFQKSSSSEIKSEALSINEFSWFRPSNEIAPMIIELSATIKSMSTSEFLKVCNHEMTCEMNIENCQHQEQFSHALSNVNFGLFVNDLLVNYPKWVEGHNGYYTFNKGPKCLNTLFQGDFLESISLSHWLAQENNVGKEWEEVITPDFNGNKFTSGRYLKVCQELQFLSFLVLMAKEQNHQPVSLISSIYKQKNAKSKMDAQGQISFFDIETSLTPLYDRIFINLVNPPKKNPHHYLTTQISTHGENLANDGYLYVFSNQKLFVPSHSEKVQALLNKYKLHTRINLERLDGKGEIAKYIYIFSKKILNKKEDFLSNLNNTVQKESCTSLNFSGSLTHFSKFELLKDEFSLVISNSESINSPLFQNELEEGLTFEFHQDAILGGKLLSNNGDNNNITHPSYFKNLTRTCIPIDQFFIVENLSAKVEKNTSELLGLSFKAEERFPYLLIVDFTNENDIRVELTTTDLLRAKIQEYGNAYFQYFGLIPKLANMNINLLREFFETTVGKQIIQLTFNGGLTKMKSKLRAMLVPKFIMEVNYLGDDSTSDLEIFTKEITQLTKYHPETLLKQVSDAATYVESLKVSYPWHLSCILSHFKTTLEDHLVRKPGNDECNYENPAIINELVQLETRAIYPSNPDIYLSMVTGDRNSIHEPLSFTEIKKVESGLALVLHNKANPIVELHGEKELLNFISFILGSAAGTQISSLLQNLRVPSASDIKFVLDSQTETSETLEKVLIQTKSLLNSIIIGQIFN
jgi:hypothetical protein